MGKWEYKRDVEVQMDPPDDQRKTEPQICPYSLRDIAATRYRGVWRTLDLANMWTVEEHVQLFGSHQMIEPELLHLRHSTKLCDPMKLEAGVICAV